MARDFGITNFRAGAAPTSPVAGDTYWDTTTLAAYVWNGTAWVPMGGVPAPGPRPGPVLTNVASSQMAWQWPDTKLYVAQTGPGVSFAQFIRFNGSQYVAAMANTETNAEVVGLVVWVGSDEFVFQTSGIVTGLSGMTPGTVYYLGGAGGVGAGTMTPTEPTTPGTVSKPVLIALSATVGLLLSMRGLVIPSQSGPPQNAAWGVIDEKTILTNQAGIGAQTDVTGLTITFTPVAGRAYRAICTGGQMLPPTATTAMQVFITDASNNIIAGQAVSGASGTAANWPVSFRSPKLTGLAAGTPVTYKVRAQTTTGSGTIGASANNPWVFSIEDVGPG